MRPIEVRVLSAALDEEQARVSLEVFCSSAGAMENMPQFRKLNERWIVTRDALRAAQGEFVREINALQVLAPVVPA